MRDLVDRQEAIKILRTTNWLATIKVFYKAIDHKLCTDEDKIEEFLNCLPSEEPKLKTGKWVTDDEDDEYINCSCCKNARWSRVPYEQLVSRFRFCPNCGADMRGC